MSLRRVRRALISVSNKTGLVDLARSLLEHAVELISTGGTRKTLIDAGLTVRDVSEVTGFPEILDGRVKTLHPNIHAGILAVRDSSSHDAALSEHQIEPIDLVVCNLYPFEATVAKGSAHEEIVENIDIGGPSMIRSAAKNYHGVAVVSDVSQYGDVVRELADNDGALTPTTRQRLAAAAFARTAAYDQAISDYFESIEKSKEWSSTYGVSFELRASLRYGENPHQTAAFYTARGIDYPCVATSEVLHGKELSYNNILDVDSAFSLVCEFDEPAAVVIKHNNPCGAAVGDKLADAFQKAYDGDPLSAFGGILAFNRQVDDDTAELITDPKRFIECIIAPGYDNAALQRLRSWKKSVRILRTMPIPADLIERRKRTADFRRVDGGLLVQSRDLGTAEFAQVKVATQRAPTESEMGDLAFAWLVAKHVKSNAIVLAKDRMLVGVGAGQMSRVDSVQIAVRKAGDRVKGSVLASDAFFPFRDNVDAAAAAGVTAIAQPGGSMRDDESIAACNEHGLAMIITGMSHFRH